MPIERSRGNQQRTVRSAGPGEEDGIRTLGTDDRTTAFEFEDSHAGACRVVTKRVLWFLPCYARCHAVPRGSFAISFANSLYQPMSAYPAKTDELDGNHWVSF
jgi:hypothetical protein